MSEEKIEVRFVKGYACGIIQYSEGDVVNLPEAKAKEAIKSKCAVKNKQPKEGE